MPWIDDTRCNGCGICVDECPTGTIKVKEEKATIYMEGCIRCALCHDVCPQEAVRHDSDRVPERIQNNVEEAKKNVAACVQYLGSEEEGQKCLQRMIKHFTREKNIAEKTVEALKKLEDS
jgi:ferredoxin